MSKENLLPHQQRVIVKRDELREDMQKLSEFIFYDKFFLDLDIREQNLLMGQLVAMENYEGILNLRLFLWGVE